MSNVERPLVGLVMGSIGDWDTVRHAAHTLDSLRVPFEARIVSAHRTPDLLHDYAATAQERGIQVVIAAAGGAAHLPGMIAAKSLLPVIGVPIESLALHGIDSLLSIVQMPGGVPVATMAVGRPGAVNSALYAASILALSHSKIADALRTFREAQTAQVLATHVPGFDDRGLPIHADAAI